MFVALAVAVMTSTASAPVEAPHRGWLLAQAWPDENPAPLETMSRKQLLKEQERLEGQLQPAGGATAMIVIGAMVTGAGVVAALLGLVMAGALFSSQTGLGVGLLIGGGAGLVLGLVLLIAGINQRGAVSRENEPLNKRLEELERRLDQPEEPPRLPPEIPQVDRATRRQHLAPA